jgi:hypothetical protein
VRKLKRFVGVFGAALIVAVAGGNIHAQPGERQLPADLLFSAGDAAGGDRFFHTLVQVDAQTLDTSYLYVDEGIRAIIRLPGRTMNRKFISQLIWAIYAA